MALAFGWNTSPTFDEPGHITTGYHYLKNRGAGFQMSTTGNLVLSQQWLALPLLAMNLEFPSKEAQQAAAAERHDVTHLFIFSPSNGWQRIVRAARAMNILLGMAFAGIVYLWSRRLFGWEAGLLSLAFCCLNPVIISNSGVATTDMAGALGLLLATAACWGLLHRISLWMVAGCGIAVGALMATKLSGVLVFPTVAGLCAFRLWWGRPLAIVLPGGGRREERRRWRQVAWFALASVGVAIIAFAVLWAAYGFHGEFGKPEQAGGPSIWSIFDKQPAGLIRRCVNFCRDLHLLPDLFLFDVSYLDKTVQARRAFLLGDYSINGWWYFFPFAWFYKTPVPFLIAFCGAAGVLAWKCWRRLVGAAASMAGEDGLWANAYGFVPLAAVSAVYMAAAMQGNIDIGIRHLLPVYPAIFIFAGSLAPAALRLGRVGLVILAGLLAWSAREAVSVHPEYLAYINQFGGGIETGHEVLIDSSYEWGQDLPAVEGWLAARAARPGPKLQVYLSYFGNADLRQFKLGDAKLLPCYFDTRPSQLFALSPGTYIISATMLHTEYGLVFGPWRQSYELAYQSLTEQVRRLETLLNDRTALQRLIESEGTELWQKRIRLYDELRFARLCAYLRRRVPDARISYGMLVYELTGEQLQEAMFGPVPGMKEGYRIKGTEGMKPGSLDFID